MLAILGLEIDAPSVLCHLRVCRCRLLNDGYLCADRGRKVRAHCRTTQVQLADIFDQLAGCLTRGVLGVFNARLLRFAGMPPRYS